MKYFLDQTSQPCCIQNLCSGFHLIKDITAKAELNKIYSGKVKLSIKQAKD